MTTATPEQLPLHALPTAQQLATQFLVCLDGELTDLQLLEVYRRNATDPRYSATTSCASHDFCDANMVMAEAFETLTGVEVDVDNDTQCALWGAAWALAFREMCCRHRLLGALDDAIATTRVRIREERGAIRIAEGWDREHAIRELAFYLSLQRRQVVRRARRLNGDWS